MRFHGLAKHATPDMTPHRTYSSSTSAGPYDWNDFRRICGFLFSRSKIICPNSPFAHENLYTLVTV